MTPDGVADTTKGITEIVAGTGGEELRGFSGESMPTACIESRDGPACYSSRSAPPSIGRRSLKSADGCGIRVAASATEGIEYSVGYLERMMNTGAVRRVESLGPVLVASTNTECAAAIGQTGDQAGFTPGYPARFEGPWLCITRSDALVVLLRRR